MGDMADMAIEDGLSQWLDGDDYQDSNPFPHHVCKYCGQGGLKWIRSYGGWRLANPRNEAIHACAPHPSQPKPPQLQPQGGNMAIRQRKIVYVTDRGQEFEIARMTATHLMNTLAHIQKQIDAVTAVQIVEGLPERDENIRKRVSNLVEAQHLLYEELTRRNPDADEEYEAAMCVGHDDY